MTERVLVIGAHCDDESFGCLGTLLKHKEAGDEFYFLAFTYGRQTLGGYQEVEKYFNSYITKPEYKDQELDTYPFKSIINDVEFVISWFKPTIVYCPFIGDLNRDHRIVAEATMVACRPYLPNAPKVWMYAINGTTELGLREFRRDRQEVIDLETKFKLLKQWYPNELINEREFVNKSEFFEKWPQT